VSVVPGETFDIALAGIDRQPNSHRVTLEVARKQQAKKTPKTGNRPRKGHRAGGQKNPVSRCVKDFLGSPGFGGAYQWSGAKDLEDPARAGLASGRRPVAKTHSKSVAEGFAAE